MKKIIVIGACHHNTLGVLRSLGEAGLKSQIILISVSISKNYVYKTKYVKKQNVFQVKDESQIVDTILKIAKTETTKPVVLCCGDLFIKEVDLATDLLKPYCILPTAGIQSRIAFFLNKDEQYNLAKACGLCEPKNWLVKAGNKLGISQISFPCIVKPMNSTLGAKTDITICQTREELINVVNKLDYDIRIEEYIKKVLEFQLIGCSLENEIIIPGYTIIIRQPKNTNTGYLKYSPIQDKTISTELLDKVRSFIKQIGYKGLFSVEFIRDAKGNDYFLEINMRNDGNAYCVTVAGVNLPYIWYKYAGTSKHLTENTTFEKSIYWMPELQDIRNIKQVGIIKWIKEFCSADAHAVFQLKDMQPFFAKVLEKYF